MNNNSTGQARTRVADAIYRQGLRVYGDRAQCPAHDDRHPSLTISNATAYNGVVLHCHAGCVEEDIWKALGLTQADRYNRKTSTTRDTINSLRHKEVMWYPGDKGRKQRLAYDAFLRRADTANTLTVDYAKRDVARDSALSDEAARLAVRELCALGLLHPHGTPATNRYAASYTLVTEYKGTLFHSGPHGKYSNLDRGSLYHFLCGLFWNSQNMISPESELAVWLRPSGLAVVRVMTKAMMSEAEIVKASGVSKSTVWRILRCKLRSNGLAEEIGGRWTLGDLTGFHPGTDISGSRERRRKQDRADREAKLNGYRSDSARTVGQRVCDREDGRVAVVRYAPHPGDGMDYGPPEGFYLFSAEERESMAMYLCVGCDAEVRDKWKTERIVL